MLPDKRPLWITHDNGGEQTKSMEHSFSLLLKKKKTHHWSTYISSLIIQFIGQYFFLFLVNLSTCSFMVWKLSLRNCDLGFGMLDADMLDIAVHWECPWRWTCWSWNYITSCKLAMWQPYERSLGISLFFFTRNQFYNFILFPPWRGKFIMFIICSFFVGLLAS